MKFLPVVAAKNIKLAN